MEVQTCIFLGIKVKPGPIERFKLENYTLDNTVDNLKSEAEKKTNVPSTSLELIYHGKILKENHTLQDSGVKNGEMVHVVKKKEHQAPAQPPTYTDAELQQLNNSLRTLGCTPNAPGWTRAMQILNEEPIISEIIDQAPSLGQDCVAFSILHEVELLAALGANVATMRRGADAHPELPHALRHLTRLVHARADTAPTDAVPTSGFAYSLEALSEDEDADEEDAEETERSPITQEQLAAALQQAATEAVSAASVSRSSSGSGSGAATGANRDSLLRLLRSAGEAGRTPPAAGAGRGGTALPSLITAEMFSEAISEAISRASTRDPAASSAALEQNTQASSSQGTGTNSREDFSAQLSRMHEMGLLDDALNVRALLICAGDVNAAINLVFSGAIGDD